MSNLSKLAKAAADALRWAGQEADESAILDLLQAKAALHQSTARGARVALRDLGFDKSEIDRLMAREDELTDDELAEIEAKPLDQWLSEEYPEDDA